MTQDSDFEAEYDGLFQDAQNLNFPSKFDAVWLGPYIIRETIPNIQCNWRLWMERAFQLAHPAVGARSTRLECDSLPVSKRLWIHPLMVASYVSPIMSQPLLAPLY